MGLGVGDAVIVGVGVGVCVGWGVGVCVGEGLGVGERDGDGVGVGEGDGLGFAETMFGWIKFEEISNSEITANTTTIKKVFLDLPICCPFNSFTGILLIASRMIFCTYLTNVFDFGSLKSCNTIM